MHRVGSLASFANRLFLARLVWIRLRAVAIRAFEANSGILAKRKKGLRGLIMAKRKKKKVRRGPSMKAVKAKIAKLTRITQKNVRDLGVLSHMFDE